MDREDAKGASKSLKKTIGEIVLFLEHDVRPPAKQLRNFLHEKLADLSEMWLRRGFKRGHKVSYARFMTDRAFPRTIYYEANRELFTGKKREVRLESSVKMRRR